MLFAPELIFIMAPKEYYEAIWIIPPVATSILFVFIYQIFGNIEFFYKEKKYMTFASIFSALINVLLNYLLIPKFGYIVAGYTTLISYMFFGYMHYFFAKKVMKRNTNEWVFRFKDILLVSSILIGSSLIILFTYSNNILRYSLIVVLFIAIILNINKIYNYIRNALSG